MKYKTNPNHIAGIYNYCDRWCERCTFTSRCAVYANTSNLTAEENDINNKAFWENLSSCFADVLEMLHEAAEKHGIEIKPLTEAELTAYKKEDKARRIKIEAHPLIKAAKQYYEQARQLLEQKDLLQPDGQEMVQMVELGIKPVKQAEKELDELQDCFEIVQWYLFQIYVKFMRAMPEKRGELKDETFKSDSDGSAKVALIGIDRCLIAWQIIMHHLPKAQDEIIALLALLQKMLRLGEQTFPDARKFKRIAFDD